MNGLHHRSEQSRPLLSLAGGGGGAVFPLSSVMSPALLLINIYRVNELDKVVEKGITDQSCFLVDNRL